MKIIQWKIILVVLIIGICFVTCDNKNNKSDKKDKQSSSNKKKCKNNNGRGKGSSEVDCDDSGEPKKLDGFTESASNGSGPPAVESEHVVLESDPVKLELHPVISESVSTVIPDKVVSESDLIPPESEPITEPNRNMSDTTDPFTDEPIDGIDAVTIRNIDSENNANDNEGKAIEINTMLSGSPITPIPNIANEFKPSSANIPKATKYTIRPASIQVSTPNPPNRATKSKSNKDNGNTQNQGSGRPSNCKNCRHPTTTTKIPTKNKTFKPMRHDDSNNNDGKHNNIKNSNFGTNKPINGIKNQRYFTNEQNFWFGIYHPNRINTFYRPTNYFRVGQNYWYGLFLPNLKAFSPNGCLVCNQQIAKQKASILNKN